MYQRSLMAYRKAASIPGVTYWNADTLQRPVGLLMELNQTSVCSALQIWSNASLFCWVRLTSACEDIPPQNNDYYNKEHHYETKQTVTHYSRRYPRSMLLPVSFPLHTPRRSYVFLEYSSFSLACFPFTSRSFNLLTFSQANIP